MLFNYPTTSHIGVQIWVCNLENPRFWHKALTSKLRTYPTEIYLDTYNLPPSWNFETSEIRGSHWSDRYFGRFRRPKKF
ncbi:unnamed protein product [Hymenolepis diminuta]|uniref:Uncharacterized protein n=1 Tax=Hymenolepis diminuta TaxID=6216 RepID=A0A564YPW7_HYMDI|nr:unnamed protein product [Hymenolepis diminuta]